MAEAAKKKLARRQVRRRNGQLVVIYVDVETGQEITNLDGYEISSGDGFATPTTPTTPTPAPAKPAASGGGGSSTSDQRYDPIWDNPKSVGSGDIVKDFQTAGSNLQRNVTNLKQEAINAGLKTVGAKTTTTPVGPANEAPTWEQVQELRTGGNEGYEPPSNGAYSQAKWISGNKEVDPKLMDIINEAALRSPYIVEVVSGKDSRATAPSKNGSRHPHGTAMDIQLRDPDTGKILPNYQDASTFRTYEQFAQTAKTVQANKYPEMNSKFVWGGYFMNGGPGSYGNMDSMHFDFGTGAMGAGSWEAGLTNASMLKAYPTLKTEGMGDVKAWKLTPPGESPIPEHQVAKQAAATAQQQAPASTLTPGAQAVMDKGVNIPTYENTRGTAALDQILLGMQQDASNAWGAGVLPNGKVGINPVDTVRASFNEGYRDPLPGEITPWTQIKQAGEEGLPHDLGPKMPWHTDPPAQQSAAPTATREGGMSRVPPGFDYQLPQQSQGNSATMARFNANMPVGYYDAALAQAQPADPYGYIKDAYLSQIEKAEGGATGRLFGGREVSDLSKHPDTRIYYNEGKDWSTAAGSYQITAPTWNEFAPKVGATDFSAENQKKVGWAIAEANYKANTGRDLLNDLVDGNETAIASAYTNNANRWASLPGGKQPQTDINTLVRGYTESVAAGQVAQAAAMAQSSVWDSNQLPKMSVGKMASFPARETSSPFASTPIKTSGAIAKAGGTSTSPGTPHLGAGVVQSKLGTAVTSSSTAKVTAGTAKNSGSSSSPGTAFATPSKGVSGAVSGKGGAGATGAASGTITFTPPKSTPIASKPTAASISSKTNSKNNANGR